MEDLRFEMRSNGSLYDFLLQSYIIDYVDNFFVDNYKNYPLFILSKVFVLWSMNVIDIPRKLFRSILRLQQVLWFNVLCTVWTTSLRMKARCLNWKLGKLRDESRNVFVTFLLTSLCYFRYDLFITGGPVIHAEERHICILRFQIKKRIFFYHSFCFSFSLFFALIECHEMSLCF
mgnify:CR=1 FL=1